MTVIDDGQSAADVPIMPPCLLVTASHQPDLLRNAVMCWACHGPGRLCELSTSRQSPGHVHGPSSQSLVPVANLIDDWYQGLPVGSAAPPTCLLQLQVTLPLVHWTSLLLLLLLLAAAACQSSVLLVSQGWGCLTSPGGLQERSSSNSRA
jgi:hypothetical protein